MDSLLHQALNRPYCGAILTGKQKRSEITVFVWESDGKKTFSKIEFYVIYESQR